MTRRALLLLPFLCATKAEAAGVHLTGRLDSSETEAPERIASFGKACAIFVNDDALWNSLQPLLGKDVQLSIFQP